jgi:hypothetical protein
MSLTKSTELGPKAIDLMGQRFGRYLVVAYAGRNKYAAAQWLCRCDCGVEKVVSANPLRMGKSNSCGCLKVESRKTHSMSKTPEYRAFMDAKHRCTSPSTSNFSRYGGRGIEFKFASFDEFYADIGNRPSQDHSIDRIDNNGNYEVGNVKWSTRHEQLCNRESFKRKWREAVEKAKKYIITTPSGHKETVVNMAKFCREHGLRKSNLHSTITTRGKHLGYTAQHA